MLILFLLYTQQIFLFHQSQANNMQENIDIKLIDKALYEADTEFRRKEVLRNCFKLMELVEKNNSNPGADEKQIKQLIDNNLWKPIEQPPPALFLNPQTVYPLTKMGNFGRLDRTCRLVNAGIMEIEANSQPKLKQIKSFLNKVQTVNGRNNQKIDWHEKKTAYPFRIVLVDNQGHQKGIYFPNKEVAEKVRLFYLHKFIIKSNVTNTLKKSEKRWRNAVGKNFQQLILKKLTEDKEKKGEKSNEESVNNNPVRQSQGLGEEVDRKSMNERNSQHSSSHQGYDSNFFNQLLEGQQKSRPIKGKRITIGPFLKLEQQYRQFFFSSWKASAYQQEANKSRMKAFSKSDNSWKQKSVMEMKKPQTITFCTIELPKSYGIFIKPIITITVSRNSSIEYEQSFNTMLKSKEHSLQYELLQNGNETYTLKSQITNYEVRIRGLDFLSNEQLCDEVIELKTKVFSKYTMLQSGKKGVKLEIIYDNSQWKEETEQEKGQSNEGNGLELQPLNEEVSNRLKAFWEESMRQKANYNPKHDVKILEILQLMPDIPEYWSAGLNEEQYRLVGLMGKAARIAGFKLTQSILPISRALKKIYSDTEELVQSLMSLHTNYLYGYYMEINKVQGLHKILGLEGEIDFGSKVSIQMSMIRKLVEIQCEEMETEMRRKNIAYVHVLYEYIYEGFSRNFPLHTLVELWNFSFTNHSLIQLYFILITVWLCKFYAGKLMSCAGVKEVCGVLESMHTGEAQSIIRDIITLRDKYFQQGQLPKPLEPILIDFYKRETQQMDIRKESRQIEKQFVLRNLQSTMPLAITPYPSKAYCLHIYFYHLPTVPGSLYIKTNGIQYECLNYQHQRYFIINTVQTKVTLQFINNKSNEYTGEVLCMPGVNRYQIDLVSETDGQVHKVEYLCGLLRNNHMEILQRNKNIQHHIGSFMTQESFFMQVLRPEEECHFLKGKGSLNHEELGNRIKVLFTNQDKLFNEVEFYMRWVSESSLSLPEQLQAINQLAAILSEEYLLSDGNKCLERVLLQMFLNVGQFPINNSQFQSFYSDSVECELDAPKVLKCVFVYPSGKKIQLEHLANQYYSQKWSTHLFGDIVIEELLQFLKPTLEMQLINVTEGTLRILYSSNGEVHNVEFPLVKKKHNKEIYIPDDRVKVGANLMESHPEMLMSEIVPSLSKIHSILDFVNQGVSKATENKAEKSVPEAINLLKYCEQKLGNVLFMRYRQYPSQVRIPFLNYFHQLQSQPSIPPIPSKLYINNTLADLRTVCTLDRKMHFGLTPRSEDAIQFITEIGLYGNLRNIQANTLYFWPIDHPEVKFNAEIFMNYGFGICRWEHCQVKGYRYCQQTQSNQLQKQYLVAYKGNQIFVPEDQLKIKPGFEDLLHQIDTKSQKSKIKRSQQFILSSNRK